MPEQTYDETLTMRRSFTGKSCKMHYAGSPLKITKAFKQYMYDHLGNEYLDCINNVAHVGHCHPHVVSAGQAQMAQLGIATGFLCELQALYAKSVIDTLPESLSVCYFVNSGSEANDLALQLAREYTKHDDVVVIDKSFHGNIGSMVEINHQSRNQHRIKKDHVHVVPCPDMYRGKYCLHPDAAECYLKDFQKVIQDTCNQGRKIAAFISECLLSQAGVIIPPQNYFKHAYSY